jgi:rhodanese-related sulfurtransferase
MSFLQSPQTVLSPVSIGSFAIVAIVVFYGFDYLRSDSDTGKSPDNTSEMSRTVALDDSMLIDYAAASEKIAETDSSVTVLDIRSGSFFASEHIPRAKNASPETLTNLSVPEGSVAILVTSVGDERGLGAAAAATLRKTNPHTAVFVLDGGFEMWKASGGRTVSFGNPNLASDHSKMHFITPDDAKKRFSLNRSFIILDMRPHRLYAQKHIPNSINLPLDQLEYHYDKIPSGVKLIVFGNSELEDFQAGVRLHDLGFFSVDVLKGGFQGWKNKGFPTDGS